MTYAEFMMHVDSYLIEKIGAMQLDLEDHLWYDAFEDGMEPSEAVEDFLYDKGYYLD